MCCSPWLSSSRLLRSHRMYVSLNLATAMSNSCLPCQTMKRCLHIMTLAHPNGQPLINKNGLLPGASGCVTFQPCDHFGGFLHRHSITFLVDIFGLCWGWCFNPSARVWVELVIDSPELNHEFVPPYHGAAVPAVPKLPPALSSD